MSGPLKLTAAQMHTLGAALDAMTQMTKQFGVTFTPYSRLELGLDNNVLKVSWDGEAYVIDDRNGD